MCLITYAPKGVVSLDLAALSISRRTNSDGYGLSWYDRGSGLWNVAKSMRAYTLERVLKRAPEDAPIVIHQRFATHGAKDLDNAHPFGVKGGILVFHNGVISGTRADSKWKTKDSNGKETYATPSYSDTRAYVEDELAPIIQAAGTGWLRHPRGVNALEGRVGSGNVLTICTPNNPVPVIVNEQRGTWLNGIYYSNTYSISDWRSPYGSMYGSTFDYDEWEDFVRERDAKKLTKHKSDEDDSDEPLPVDKVIYLSDAASRVEDEESCAYSPLAYESKPDWMDEDEWQRWQGAVLSGS